MMPMMIHLEPSWVPSRTPLAAEAAGFHAAITWTPAPRRSVIDTREEVIWISPELYPSRNEALVAAMTELRGRLIEFRPLQDVPPAGELRQSPCHPNARLILTMTDGLYVCGECEAIAVPTKEVSP